MELSPDFWQNLQNFGFATAAAGAQPGMTLGGAVGQGGMAMAEMQRQRQLAQAQAALQQQQGAYYGAETQQKMAEAAMLRAKLNMFNMPSPYDPGAGTGAGAGAGAGVGMGSGPGISGGNPQNLGSPGLSPNQAVAPQLNVGVGQNASALPGMPQMPTSTQMPIPAMGGMSQAASDNPSSNLPLATKNDMLRLQGLREFYNKREALLGIKAPVMEQDGTFRDPDGNIKIIPGGPADVNFQANMAGAKKGAEARGELPSQLTLARARESARMSADLGINAGSIVPQTVVDANGQEQTIYATRGQLAGAGSLPTKLSPGDLDVMKERANLFATKDNAAYQAAMLGKASNTEMLANLDALKASGSNVLTPGPGFEAGVNYAKTINKLVTASGFTPSFDPAAVSRAEDVLKLANRSGMDLIQSKFGGSREAYGLIQKGMASVASGSNSYLGAKFIMNALDAANDYQIDRYKMLDQYRQQHAGSLLGADTYVASHITPEMYARRAISSPEAPISINYNAKTPDDLRVKLSKMYVPGTWMKLPNGNIVQFDPYGTLKSAAQNGQ